MSKEKKKSLSKNERFFNLRRKTTKFQFCFFSNEEIFAMIVHESQNIACVRAFVCVCNEKGGKNNKFACGAKDYAHPHLTRVIKGDGIG